MRRIIVQEPKQDAQQIQRQQDHGQADDGSQSGLVHPFFDKSGHGGEDLGRDQIDHGQSEGGEDRDNIEAFIAGSFFCEFPQCFHPCTPDRSIHVKERAGWMCGKV